MKTGFLSGLTLMLFMSFALFVSCKNDDGDKQISLNETELNMNIGESVQLTVTPASNAVTWESSDPSVATVVNGLVTAIDNGQTTIKAIVGGRPATCLVTVADVFITLDETEASLWVGYTKQLTATIDPEGIPYTWESSDEAVATVDENGLVTGVGVGTVTISAVIGSNRADCEFTVTEAEITVWTLGNYSTSSNSPKPQYVRIYKNDEIFVELTDASSNSVGEDMVIDGDYLYVCGSEDKPFIGKVWKVNINTKEVTTTNLSDGANNVYPKSIFVSGGKVYVGGYELISSVTQPRYWIDGVQQPDLNRDGTGNGSVSSVFVEGNDVYLGGMDGGNGAMWKNGVYSVIAPTLAGTNAIVNDLTVSNGVVYAVGTFGARNARQWTDGVSLSLPSPKSKGTPYDVIVHEGDVYVVGQAVTDDALPLLLKTAAGAWKNGEFLYYMWNEIASSGTANGIAVMDGDVYVVGSETRTRTQLMVWKNGEELWQLSHITESPYSMSGSAIVVTKR